MIKTKFLRASDVKFYEMEQKVSLYLFPNYQSMGIDQPTINNLVFLQQDWHIEWKKYLNPHTATSVQQQIKTNARLKYSDLLINTIDYKIYSNPLVTDVDYISMGLPIPNEKRGPRNTMEITDVPELELVLHQNGVIAIKVWNTAHQKSRPKGTVGVQIKYTFSDVQPTTTEEYTKELFLTNHSGNIIFDKKDGGKKVYFIARWLGKGSKTGIFSRPIYGFVFF